MCFVVLNVVVFDFGLWLLLDVEGGGLDCDGE